MDQLFPFFDQSVMAGVVFATMVWMRKDHRSEMEEMRRWYDDQIARLERRVDSLEREEIRRAAAAHATQKKLEEHASAIRKRPRYESVKRIAAEQKRAEKGET